jgi:hypothetical protein
MVYVMLFNIFELIVDDLVQSREGLPPPEAMHLSNERCAAPFAL